ncbi:MAG: YfhO family protein, partial [Firmicutes bacterium]|nr:YfhO family protein [Bacillota bacterium]
TVLEKDKRKKFSAYLGLYTITALLISMAVVFPSVLKWAGSSRIAEKESGSYLDSLKILRGYFANNAAFMLYGSELGIAAAAVGLIKAKLAGQKPVRRDIFNIIMLILLIIPLFAEPVNIMWHFGSYDSFPCRYAFILTFAALEAYAAYTVSVKERTHKKYAVYICIILMFLCIAAAAAFGLGFMRYGIYDIALYKKYIMLFPLLILMFALMHAFISRRAAGFITVTSAFCLSVILCIGFISPLRNAEYDSAQTTATMNTFIKESTMLDGALDFKNDNITRIKTVTPDLSPNFGLILERPTLSSWTNEASYGYLDQMRRFGYGIIKTKILSEGGTAFTDAFLNVGTVVSKYPVNEELYEKTQTVGDFNIYRCKNVFPFGLLVTKNFFITSFPAEGIKMQNLLYNNLTGSLENIIEDVKPYYDHTEKVGEWDGYCYALDIKGKKTLYARTDPENKSNGYVFYINGAAHYFPYFDDPNAYIYPREHINGFVELGTFENENVSLVVASPDKDLEMLEIGLLDNDRLENLIKCYENQHAENVVADKNKMSMTAEAPCDCFMFLPVEYDINWEAEVNGQKADILPVLNNAFMAVDLPAGHCDIKMKYKPKNFYMGGALS